MTRVVRRRLLLGGAVTALVVVGLAGWFGVTALQARDDLTAAADHAQQARAALLAGDVATAEQQVAAATEAAAGAHRATASPPWDLAAALPWVGGPLRTVRELSAVVDDLTAEVLTPAVQAGTALDPSSLRGPDGRLDLPAFTAAAPALDRAAAAARDVRDRAAAVPAAPAVGRVEAARTTLAAQTRELADQLTATSTAAQLLPGMLGADGSRSYFLGFQTGAEARGTGGLLGGFAILDADGGRISLDALASNQELRNDAPQGIDLGPDFQQLYGTYSSATVWQNSNVSPHFPYAATIWQSLWQRQTGQRVDGAIATDPVALSYLLEAVGPVRTPGGELVTAQDVVALTESEAYVRFAGDTAARKAFLTSIAAAVFDRVVTAPADRTPALLRALARATGEGRLAVWSAAPAEQELLAQTPLAHAVPETTAPYADVVVNNAAGNKLDYYLGRTVDYSAGGCDAATRPSQVRVTLTNAVPATGLPQYVDGRLDRGGSGPEGTNRSLVTLYATQGAQLRGVTVDGAPQRFRVGVERGHPAFTVDVQVPPGATVVLVLDLVEPTVAGAAQVPLQPLVSPVTVTGRVPECREVVPGG